MTGNYIGSVSAHLYYKAACLIVRPGVSAAAIVSSCQVASRLPAPVSSGIVFRVLHNSLAHEIWQIHPFLQGMCGCACLDAMCIYCVSGADQLGNLHQKQQQD